MTVTANSAEPPGTSGGPCDPFGFPACDRFAAT